MANELPLADGTSTQITNRSIAVLDLTEDDMNEAMASLGVRPEDLKDPSERTSYEEYLAKRNARR